MKQTIEFYPADAEARLARSTKIWKIITAGIAVTALAVCVALTCGVTTANASRRELLVCSVSVLAGWIVIFLLKHFVFGMGQELIHLRTLNDEPREAVTGEVTADSRRFHIPSSITVQSLYVHTQTETHRVSINTRLLRKLPKLPATLTLYTVHGYVVAYEECHASH